MGGGGVTEPLPIRKSEVTCAHPLAAPGTLRGARGCHPISWPEGSPLGGTRRSCLARMAELADALDSGSSVRKDVEVQVLFFAQVISGG